MLIESGFKDEFEQFGESYQWTIGQLMPELMSPGRQLLKSDIQSATHTYTTRYSDSVNVTGRTGQTEDGEIVEVINRVGKLWFFFAPCNDLYTVSSKDPDVENYIDHFAFYASSNGPYPINDANSFHWNEYLLNSSRQASSLMATYKNVRVNSAAMVIKLICPEKDRSGVLHIGYGFKGLIQNIQGFEFSDFHNQFAYSKTINMSDYSEVVCRHRLPFADYSTFAPYTPAKSMPYFFVLGEGLPLGASLDVTCIRHVEGIPHNKFSDTTTLGFAEPTSAPLDIQKAIISACSRDSNIIQSCPKNIPEWLRLNTTPALTPRELAITLADNVLYQAQIEELKKQGIKKTLDSEITKQLKEYRKQIGDFIETLRQTTSNADVVGYLEDVRDTYNPNATNSENMFAFAKKSIPRIAKDLKRAGFNIPGEQFVFNLIR